MAKTAGTKLRVLLVYEILREKSSPERPLTVPEIQEELARRGVECDRKSVYSDIGALCDFGYEIEQKRGRDGGYFLRGRDFELGELKLLVDAVQSSKFITPERSRELIAKLVALAGERDAGSLSRQVFITNRVKTANESVLRSVDAIHTAIAENRQIEFDYTDWAVNFGPGETFVRRRRGERRRVSPAALAWDDENYYLISYDSARGERRNFRVDKMENIVIADEPRDRRWDYGAFDPGAYSREMFGMFHGDRRQVKLRFERRFAGVAVDRLGRDVHVSPDGDSHFLLTCEVEVSPQFFAWLIGLEGGAELLEPKDAREALKRLVAAAEEMYR